ncbi:MAG TPA: hypothetical protein DCS43_07950 [Verrucomicrobia bacterium]|nr:hypothetical protein [Verrucomicrobiota bacterium]
MEHRRHRADHSMEADHHTPGTDGAQEGRAQEGTPFWFLLEAFRGGTQKPDPSPKYIRPLEKPREKRHG